MIERVSDEKCSNKLIKVSSLKRFTEDVREVSSGMECGIGIEGFNDLMPDDIIEFYTMEQDKREPASR